MFSGDAFLLRPGLYKIFDEILVNAADNFVRDNSQTYVKALPSCGVKNSHMQRHSQRILDVVRFI